MKTLEYEIGIGESLQPERTSGTIRKEKRRVD